MNEDAFDEYLGSLAMYRSVVGTGRLYSLREVVERLGFDYGELAAEAEQEDQR